MACGQFPNLRKGTVQFRAQDKELRRHDVVAPRRTQKVLSRRLTGEELVATQRCLV